MDDDSLRRGRPTLHVVSGDGMAILAGDGLQAEAFALLAREPDDAALADRRKLRVLGAGGRRGWPRGHGRRTGDRSRRRRPDAWRPPVTLDAPALADMHARKTGALIRAAAVAGAMMAGGDDADDRRRRRLGRRGRARLPDRRRRPRRRGRVGRPGQDLGQGRRRRQADLSGALRRGAVEGARRRGRRPRRRRPGRRRPGRGSPGGDRPLDRRAASRRRSMKLRLDQLLVRRGLVESRERAQALILAGQVDLDGTGRGQGRHHGVGARRGARHRPRSSVGQPRRRQAGPRARQLRPRRRRTARPRRRRLDRRLHRRAARPRRAATSSPSTSAGASCTGSCAPTRASPSSRA